MISYAIIEKASYQLLMQGLIRAAKASTVTFVGFQYKKIRTFPFRSTIMKRKRNVLFYFLKHRYSAVIRSADGTKPQFTKSWNSIP